MKYSGLFLISGLFSLAATAVHAQHADIRPYIAGGRIVTGTAELDGGIVVPISNHARVFGSEFGEDDPGQPFLAEDPGFLSEDGAFPGGSGHFVGFNALAGLRLWTGSGFGPVPDFETLQVTRGSQSINVGAAPTAGFNFAVIDTHGGLHDHMAYELYGADGNPVPGDGVEPTAGIFLLELELTTTMPGVGASLPLWIVFNSGGEDFEEHHEAAVQWVETHLVPEPMTGLLLALGAGLALRRKRRPDEEL